MSKITHLQDQEQFNFRVRRVPCQPDISVNAPFVYQHGQITQLSHLKLSEPNTCTIQLDFINSDHHYGTHLANIVVRSFDYPCRYTGQSSTSYVIEKFESHTLDTSTLHEDLQSNFMYLVSEEYASYLIDLSS
jgi:hypothetical protein